MSDDIHFCGEQEDPGEAVGTCCDRKSTYLGWSGEAPADQEQFEQNPAGCKGASQAGVVGN